MNTMRYMVIEVGCLECTGGSADPAIILSTDDRDQAHTISAESTGTDSARFVIDRDNGVIDPTSSWSADWYARHTPKVNYTGVTIPADPVQE